VIAVVLEIVTVEDHAAVHGPGTMTMSPVLAELIAVCTSDCEQEAALIVLAWAGRHQNKANAMMICTFIGDHLRSHQGERIAGDCNSRLLPIIGFPRRSFCPDFSPVPRTLILPTPTPYSVGFGKA